MVNQNLLRIILIVCIFILHNTLMGAIVCTDLHDQQEVDWQLVAEQAKKAIIKVSTGNIVWCSAFFLNDKGEFLIPKTMLSLRQPIEIKVFGIHESLEAAIINENIGFSLALMRLTSESNAKILRELGCITYLELKAIPAVRLDSVIVLGYSLQGLMYIQTHIAGTWQINTETRLALPNCLKLGLAGGPLIDKHGAVLGISHSSESSLIYVVPISTVINRLQELGMLTTDLYIDTN